MDEMDEPGKTGLDVHINDVLEGEPSHDYPGQQQSVGRLRITPEFSYGLTPDLEAGLYLPLATVDRQEHVSLGGAKLRLKYLAPRAAGQTYWYGINTELGRVEHRLDINPWNAEVKGIAGTRLGRWTLATNLNVDFVVSGPQHPTPVLDLDTRFGYAVGPACDCTLGLENYNNLGSTRSIGRFADQEQSVFATVDFPLAHDWEMHLGLGRGYGSNPDHVIVKAIVGVPIDGLLRPTP